MELKVPTEEQRRQAIASLRGYIYQIYASALAWVDLRTDGVLLLEVADDFAVLTRDALETVQVKDTAASGAVTLRTPGVRDTINSFWRFGRDNPERRVSASFLTTSAIGRERDIGLADGTPGIQAWRAAARAGADVAPLKRVLLSLDLDVDLVKWIAGTSDEELKEGLLRRIRFECGCPPLAGMDTLLRERLTLFGDERGLLASDAHRACDAILHAVMTRVVRPEGRTLGRAQFLETFEAATSVAMSATLVRQVMSGSLGRSAGVEPAIFSGATLVGEVAVDVGTIPFPSLVVDRPALSVEISHGLSGGMIPWLHGMSGAGKTLASLSAVGCANRTWRLVSLRGLDGGQAAERLRFARRTVREPHFGGLILDDYDPASQHAARFELGLLASVVDRADAGLVLTSHRPPPPSLAGDVFAGRVLPIASPSLDEAEVGRLVTMAGGDADRWGRPTWLACGGNPALVTARVLGLRARSWPEAETLDGIWSKPATDISDERQAVRQRLLHELPADTRTLLYRLSVLLGGFDRALALAIAETASALPMAGESFEFLLGPWIEARGTDRYGVSALVADAGRQTLSPTETARIQEAVCGHLASRDTLAGEFLPQLMLSALACRHEHGLLTVAMAVLSAREEDRDAVAHLLGPMCLVRIDKPFVPTNPPLSATLRLAQLRIAVFQGDNELAARIYDRLQSELDAVSNAVGLQQSAAFMLLSSDEIGLPAARWLDMALRLRRADFVLPEEPPRPRGTRALPAMSGVDQFAFLWRALKISGVSELADLFAALDELDVPVRDRYLDLLRPEHGYDRTLVQSAWVRDADTAGFDARGVAERYLPLSTMAFGWGAIELALECVAARATLFSEYVGDHDAALALLEETDRRWPGHGRVGRERSKILFRLGRHGDVLAALETFSGAMASDAIENAYVQREIAISHFETGNRSAARAGFTKAIESCALVPSMAEMQLGLIADRAYVEFSDGDHGSALASMLAAARRLDMVDSKTKRGAYLLRIMAALATWMTNELGGREPEPGVGMVAGACSREPPREPLPGPVPAREAVWYQLRELERLTGLDLAIWAECDTRTRGSHLIAFEIAATLQDVLDASRSGDAERLIDRMIRAARVATFVGQGFEATDDAIHVPVGTLPWTAVEPDIANLQVQNLVGSSAAGFIAYSLLVHGTDASADLRSVVADTAMPHAMAVMLQKMTEARDPGSAAMRDAAVASAHHLAGAPGADAKRLWLATFRLWETVGGARLGLQFEAAVAAHASRHWMHVATKATFALRSPRSTAPAIAEAASETVDGSSLARLLIVAAEAVSLMIPVDARTQLSIAASRFNDRRDQLEEVQNDTNNA